MTIKFFLPEISLIGLPVERKFAMIRDAGFDGVEVLASRHNREQAERIRMLAKVYRLGLHWHQPWSYTENTVHWYNAVAKWLGMLEVHGYALSEAMPPERTEPYVAYADRYKEALLGSDIWLQTCAVMDDQGYHSLQFFRFAEIVAQYQFKLVFDTQHFLEWRFGAAGVEDLPTDPKVLEKALIEGWKQFSLNVVEIHCNDFDPKLGNSRGRNLPLGCGIAPLEAFAWEVRRSGWSGVVVPEISPFSLFPYRQSSLSQGYERVRHLFR